MEKPHYVHTAWEARVWVASREDVPGLATEAETAGALVTKLKTLNPELLTLIPELLTLNRRTDTRPIAFDLLTRRFELAA